MDTVERLGTALVDDHGVRPLAAMGVGAEELAGLDFVAAKDHWGSVGLVGLVRADDLGVPDIEERVTTFDGLTRSLKDHAGVLAIYTRHGSTEVKLGSFGVVCFVFERGCPDGVADIIRRQRRSVAGAKQYTLAWSADVPAGRVRDHGFLPRGVFPSKRWLQSTIRGMPASSS